MARNTIPGSGVPSGARAGDADGKKTLHTFSSALLADLDPPVIELDMDAVYQAAARSCKLFRLEFDCDGVPFVWSGLTKSSAAAEFNARADLAESHASFSHWGARLVSLVCEGA